MREGIDGLSSCGSSWGCLSLYNELRCGTRVLASIRERPWRREGLRPGIEGFWPAAASSETAAKMICNEVGGDTLRFRNHYGCAGCAFREGLRPGIEGFWPAGKAALGQAAAQGQVKGVMACLDVLERMLTQSQPVPVALPASAIFLLLTRILAFDDSPAHEGASLIKNRFHGHFSTILNISNIYTFFT